MRANGLVLVPLRLKSRGVAPRSLRWSWAAATTGCLEDRKRSTRPAGPAMVLHLLAANAEHWPRPPTQRPPSRPQRIPGHRPQPAASRKHTTCNARASPCASTDPPAPRSLEPLTLCADQHPSPPPHPERPPAHHRIMISIQQSPQPFRMSEDSGCRAVPHFSYCHFP